MKYQEFRSKVRSFPLFRSNILSHLTDHVGLLRDQIVDWVKKGLVLQLKRGLYTLNADDRKVGLSKFFLANQLYLPSYISLETALSYYELIPEAVPVTTSITTKKTQTFINAFGHFIFNHIKQPAFDYFIAVEDENGCNFDIALPEKAMVDFLYFRLAGVRDLKLDIFDESFRFQNLEILKPDLMRNIVQLFKSKKLEQAVELLIHYKELEDAS